MGQNTFGARTTIVDDTVHIVRAVGGSAAVTKVTGYGLAVTRTSTGLYKLTWSENPGIFVGYTWGLSATTLVEVAGFSVVAGVYNSTAFTLAFSVYNASNAVADLAALNWIDLVVRFKRTSA